MNRVHCLALVFVVQAWCLSVSSQATAQQGRRAPAHQLRLELDLPIVLIAGATASSFAFMSEAPGVACAPRCDKSRINGFDRFAAGLYDPAWGTVGDIATASTLAAPLLAVVLEEGLANGLNDDLVMAEAALVSSALQVSLSFAVSRPRPRVYGDDAPLEDRTNANAARSFFSGHVANTVSASVVALRTFQRLGRPGVGWAMFGAAWSPSPAPTTLACSCAAPSRGLRTSSRRQAPPGCEHSATHTDDAFTWSVCKVVAGRELRDATDCRAFRCLRRSARRNP